MRNHTSNSLRLRTKGKSLIKDFQDRAKANKPRSRTHQPIEIFSRLHYAGELTEKVNRITHEDTPNSETRTEYAKRRLAVYRQVISEAWESASPEVKAEVESVLKIEREEAAKRKEDEGDGDDEETALTAESYHE